MQEPKNKHSPHDLPHVAKVDEADFQRKVKNRVKLVKLSEKYLDKSTLSRLDDMSDLEIKKRLIMNFQKSAVLEGKSTAYINARFDSVLEDLPKEKVIAHASKMDGNAVKEMADASQARNEMIMRQQNAYKLRSK